MCQEPEGTQCAGRSGIRTFSCLHHDYRGQPHRDECHLRRGYSGSHGGRKTFQVLMRRRILRTLLILALVAVQVSLLDAQDEGFSFHEKPEEKKIDVLY